ncbi:Acetolactate synthase-1/2/3 large subunit [Pararobbsia alpina]
MYTTSTAFLEALNEAGVEYLFSNFGSDHPALIEALAQARHDGTPVPRVITCPNEMVALSAAHGFAQATGRAQAVIVHVECGTQALAGAVHNAAKGRIPVLIFAGLSPYTQQGELKGSRNEFIQWIQDVPDQRGIVRGYVKYENEFRSGHNVKQITWRALQFALSDPKGPVYLTGTREAMEQEVPPIDAEFADWQPLSPGALAADQVEELASALAVAKRPLVVTSYVGRNPLAVVELVALAHRLGLGVLESVPNYLNFPTDDVLYQGNQWNHPVQNAALDAADLVIVIDSDVPWIPTVSKPRAGTPIFHIDVDPLKQQMPLWYIPAKRSMRADARTALRQIRESIDALPVDADLVAERRAHYQALHASRARQLDELESTPAQGLTAEYVTARLRRHIDAHTTVLNEGISNYHTVINHLQLSRTGAMYTSGGGSLGWNGGAAIGVKLARPDHTVIVMTGDGSYMFSVPSSVHWMARKYATPFLTIVFNNRGWKSPKLSALAVHPTGYASKADELDVSFDPPPDYAAIAAASGGAWARRITRVDEVDAALVDALHAVREERRCAVIDIWLEKL